MPEPQAEAVVREQSRLLEHNLATKADIALIQKGIETLRQETKADIEAAKNSVVLWVVGLVFTIVSFQPLA